MTAYTKNEIEEILRREAWEYHRVELPYGLATPGPDRRPTADIIFPTRMDGKSVLDVGSALGYFSFEAERRGASRVVGTDLKENRLRQARMLREITESGVEFQARDVITDPPAECFDFVCLLNVIHHLKEPMRALRTLASVTRERLIVEFPTFSDPKFRRHALMPWAPLYNRRPLIGVSSQTDPNIDQTFVFSPVALRKILQDHDALFDSVEFRKSPLRGRLIALCSRRATNRGIHPVPAAARQVP